MKVEGAVVIRDETTSKVLHTRVVEVVNAPKLLTHNYYGPKGEEFEPKYFTIKWYDDEEPKTVDVEGIMDDGKPIKRSYGKDGIAVEQWLKDIAFPKPVTSKTFVISRKKIKTGSYDLIDRISGKKVAEAHLTGRYGADNYPWDWYLADGLTFGEDSKANTGSCDALWACIDAVESRANQYGIVGL